MVLGRKLRNVREMDGKKISEIIPISMIIPNLDHNGKFRNFNYCDGAYNMINWTNVFRLTMEAVDKEGTIARCRMEGNYDKLKEIYDLNKDDCCYAVIEQYRVLGNGRKDTCAVHYKTSGPAVKNGFRFKGVA